MAYKYLNKISSSDFSVNIPEHINSFRVSDPIFTVVQNRSGSIIEVVPDNDIRIYWLKEGVWIPIKNNISYLSRIDHLTSTTDQDPGGGIYDIQLDFETKSTSFEVCIILLGLKDPNGSAESLGTFTEITLIP